MKLVLKIPGTSIDFNVTPQYFLSLFDVYDREEDFGEYLNKFDPNNRDDLRFLFKENLFENEITRNFTTAHKAEVAKELLRILNDENFNGDDALLELHGDDFGFSLPSKWDVRDWKDFYLQGYQVVYDNWGSELAEVGLTLTKPVVFEISRLHNR
ncbi:hypothetical protein [Parachitinimonas caeni]|uniref:Immunity protein 42 of polymorphic toxin system n=1 Tax=Parachitinimonas caeni TaxID=3031301 RepID=A0ABT7E3R2_9NEIS|nr:hypothetical protein [Parachitinimonas caeni]MDK2126884.1 hypothetical protein [Parachitinimonas caeni]